MEHALPGAAQFINNAVVIYCTEKQNWVYYNIKRIKVPLDSTVDAYEFCDIRVSDTYRITINYVYMILGCDQL